MFQKKKEEQNIINENSELRERVGELEARLLKAEYAEVCIYLYLFLLIDHKILLIFTFLHKQDL